MFRFWIREIAGWLLVIAGLYIFMVTLGILLRPRDPGILEAPAVAFVGFVVFRGGIHLLKVAVAARVCMAAQIEAKKEPTLPKLAKKADGPWDW